MLYGFCSKFHTLSSSANILKLERGPMPNLMVALPNIGGALCSTPQSLADAHYQMPCSNAPKTRNPLKFARVPQTRQQISAVSRPKFTILPDMQRRYCCLTSFFPIVDTCLRCKDIARQSCAMVPRPRWRIFGDFLGQAFPASHVQHISEIDSLFAPGPIRSPERISQQNPGQFAPWNFRSLAYSLPGPFAPHGQNHYSL